jgi:signal transduction histidine kinase
MAVQAQLRVLGRCEQQARKLVRLTERLLDATRAAASPMPLARANVNLVTLVLEEVERHAASAVAAGTPIHLHAGPPIVGRWDCRRLGQALGSILDNAIKFGARHPVDVHVEAGPGIARVSVEDHGIGVGWQRRERLFQRFGRAAPVERYGGLGLDLYLARVIVEAHGGTLEVHSAADQGSTFVVTLPREAERRDAPPTT